MSNEQNNKAIKDYDKEERKPLIEALAKAMTNLANLITFNNILALGLACIFCYQEIVGNRTQEFTTVFMAIVSFYFASNLKKGE